MKCPKCSTELTGVADFCYKCGERIVYEREEDQTAGDKFFCSKCGAELEGTPFFCWRCKKRVVYPGMGEVAEVRSRRKAAYIGMVAYLTIVIAVLLTLSFFAPAAFILLSARFLQVLLIIIFLPIGFFIVYSLVHGLK